MEWGQLDANVDRDAGHGHICGGFPSVSSERQFIFPKFISDKPGYFSLLLMICYVSTW